VEIGVILNQREKIFKNFFVPVGSGRVQEKGTVARGKQPSRFGVQENEEEGNPRGMKKNLSIPSHLRYRISWMLSQERKSGDE